MRQAAEHVHLAREVVLSLTHLSHVISSHVLHFGADKLVGVFRPVHKAGPSLSEGLCLHLQLQCSDGEALKVGRSSLLGSFFSAESTCLFQHLVHIIPQALNLT